MSIAIAERKKNPLFCARRVDALKSAPMSRDIVRMHYCVVYSISLSIEFYSSLCRREFQTTIKFAFNASILVDCCIIHIPLLSPVPPSSQALLLLLKIYYHIYDNSVSFREKQCSAGSGCPLLIFNYEITTVIIAREQRDIFALNIAFN